MDGTLESPCLQGAEGASRYQPMKLSGKRTEQFGAVIIFYDVVPIVVFFRVKSCDLTLFIVKEDPSIIDSRTMLFSNS